MKIVIISGHPRADSFTQALAEAYQLGAKDNADVNLFALSQMEIDPTPIAAKPTQESWNEDIQALWDAISAADHVVITHPLWWGTMPSELKHLLDRLLLPGLAYSYAKGKALPIGHLKGKTAEVIMTSDTPDWFYRLAYGSAQTKLMKNQILKFVGLKPVQFTHISPIRNMPAEQRQTHLAKIAERARVFTSNHKKSAA
ncbi:putative NADPH-quinone reductase [Maritalea mobilis]|uniref:Putative NADPH-quinone reductase n=1 Tax=Maritalea mobilis TaxID=483324 RepID=A0A4R6VJI2_9HYPH|nr:NAD(P)H-dependent oxidoreductase [Maritalea mobilis]TDQ61748.1 putative NADPH-quinone reductase [Maritalea mobilis]